MIVKWITGFLLSAAGANLIVRILNRLDFSRWYEMVETTCQKISRAGNSKFTKAVYEPFETFFQGFITKTVEVANRGLDKDDNDPEAPAADVENKTKETDMKKMLMLFVFLGAALASAPARALDLSLDFGGFTLNAPLSVVNATQLYDFAEDRGYTGMETVLVTRGDFDLTLGAATGYGNGIQYPFIGAQIKLPAPFFETSNNDLKFGVFLGRDFDADDTKFGLKGSIELW